MEMTLLRLPADEWINHGDKYAAAGACSVTLTTMPKFDTETICEIPVKMWAYVAGKAIFLSERDLVLSRRPDFRIEETIAATILERRWPGIRFHFDFKRPST